VSASPTSGPTRPPDKLVLSFHGVPQRTVALGDPYQAHCVETARLLVEQLRIDAEHVVVTFQSRLGARSGCSRTQNPR